jgi:hypothetical protein
MATRDAQRVSLGFGKHFTSPVRPRDKKQTRELVVVPGQAEKKRRLFQEIEALKNHGGALPPPKPPPDESFMDVFTASEFAYTGPDHVDPPTGDANPDGKPASIRPVKKPKRIVPDMHAHRLFENWKQLLPDLIEPHLRYLTSTTGVTLQPPASLRTTCQKPCIRRTVTILCLFFDRQSPRIVVTVVTDS